MNFEPQAVSRAQTGGTLLPVTGDTFNRLVLQGRGPVVVEFMSYSCEHCRALEPILEQVARMAEFRGRFFIVNVALEPALSEKFEIRATPTLIMFLNGRGVGRVEGPQPTVSSILTAVTRPFRGAL